MVFLPPLWGPAREPGPPRREESHRQTPGRGLSVCHSAAELWAGKCPEPWAGPSPGPEVPPPPLPLPRPGPRSSSRRPLGLEGRGGPRPPTPVQGRPRPPPDPAPPAVPPTRPAACLRHRPAGWIWFQPSLAGLTCAVRGGCGGREVPRSRAHLAAWDAEVSAPGREQAAGLGGAGVRPAGRGGVSAAPWRPETGVGAGRRRGPARLVPLPDERVRSAPPSGPGVLNRGQAAWGRGSETRLDAPPSPWARPWVPADRGLLLPSRDPRQSPGLCRPHLLSVRTGSGLDHVAAPSPRLGCHHRWRPAFGAFIAGGLSPARSTATERIECQGLGAEPTRASTILLVKLPGYA